MSKSIGKKTGNIVVWLLMAMLIVGLGGFGVSNFGGRIDSIGSVGDEEISVNEYARALESELSALEAAGQPMTLAEAQQAGIVQIARGRVIASAALDNEVKRLGVSVGDAAVASEVRAIPAFQGLDGTFDREAYSYALERTGLTEAEFEAQIREEAARTLLQGGIVAGLRAPSGYTDTLYNYIAERRSFSYIEITPDMLDEEVRMPTADEAQEFYELNPEAYTAPETKKITYAWLTPDMIIDSVEVDDDSVRALYNERREEYLLPERRLVERLVFGTMDEAQAAADRLTSGETSFEGLVQDRGLALSDVDLGDVTQGELAAEAGAAVFGLAEPGITGPVTSGLGPAIFRMNGILYAQETSFEEAQEDLRAELAQDRARRVIADSVTDIDDRLAAGATLEELAQETDMVLGQIDYFNGQAEDIAAYEAFRDAAAPLGQRDFPEVIELDDGGIFAMRLDELVAPRLLPIDDVRDQVTADWQAEETRNMLADKAEGLRALLAAGDPMDSFGPEVITGTGLTRGAITPPTLSDPLFSLSTGETTVVDDGVGVYLLRLDEMLPPQDGDETADFLRATLDNQAAQSMAQDIFGYFAESLLATAGLNLDQQAINAVHAQFP